MTPGVWTTSPNTSCFANEFSSIWIAFFHFGQSFLFRHSSIVCGSWSLSFLMMSIATWNANILSMIMSQQFLVSLLWLIEISSVLNVYIWSICTSSRANYLSSWVSSFNFFIFVSSLTIPSFSYVVPFYFLFSFFFLRTESFEPIGLPHFKHVLNSLSMTFSNCLSRTSICVGVFTAGTCDFVTFFISMRA